MIFADRRDAAVLLLSVGSAVAAGAIGAVFTTEAIPTWYATIEKPTWNPPPWLFGPVWSLLYITIGFAAWLVWRSGRGPADALEGPIRTALLVYATQLAVNAAWSPVFFGAERIDLALVVIAALLVLIVVTISLFYQVNRLAAFLLVPYLAWVTFATILNSTIWQLNR